MTNPHRIVFANEKGGTGKSTTAMSIMGLLPGGGGVARVTRMLGIADGVMKVLGQGTEFRPQKAKDAGLVHEDLDTRLELVVPAAVAVVHTQNGVEISQQLLPRQKLIDEAAYDRRPPEATTNRYTEAQLARIISDSLKADVMNFDGGAVADGAVHSDLELARQEGELWMEC